MSPFFSKYRTILFTAIIVVIVISIIFCILKMPRSVNLDEYVLIKGPIIITYVHDNASGLAYNSETDSLFLIVNDPTMIAELSLDGVTKRIIKLIGFHDTEGIAYIGGNIFVIAEEKRNTISVIEINQSTSSIDYADRLSSFQIADIGNNKDLEGISYDHYRNQLYAVKEKNPMEIVRLPFMDWKMPESIAVNTSVKKEDFPELYDYSGVYFNARGNSLLLLSHESKCVVEVSLSDEFTMISRLLLRSGNAGLKKDIRQAEGITIDAQERLYICSEPNLLYIFSK